MPKGSSGSEDRAKVKLRVIEFELEALAMRNRSMNTRYLQRAIIGV